MTRVEELTTDAQWDAAVPILRQLWTGADASFVRSWREDPDYRLLGLYATGEDGQSGDGEELVAVAGVSVQRVLHHARHAWVHDLVVDEAHRSSGHGRALIERVERWARERDCEYVALGLRDGNEDARRFYDRAGFERWGAVLEREL